jgi:hypothetical protein
MCMTSSSSQAPAHGLYRCVRCEWFVRVFCSSALSRVDGVLPCGARQTPSCDLHGLSVPNGAGLIREWQK